MYNSNRKKLRKRVIWGQFNGSLGKSALIAAALLCVFLLKGEVDLLVKLSRDDEDIQNSQIVNLMKPGRGAGPADWEKALERRRKALGDPGTFEKPKPSSSKMKTNFTSQERRVSLNIPLKENPEEEGDASSFEGLDIPVDSEEMSDGKGNSHKSSNLDETLARDVTIVICSKHRFSLAKEQLEEVLKLTPPVPILYIMSGPMPAFLRRYFLSKRRQWPHLDLRDAGLFASGYSMRNASVEVLKTKYALFLFNDVFPLSKKWLHSLYSFAEDHPEGTVFSPFLWEKVPLSGAKKGKRREYEVENSEEEKDSFLRPHRPFVRELSFDDYGNDGKLYVETVEEEEGSGWGEGGETEDQVGEKPPRESPSAIDDNCLLVRVDFLKKSSFWDPRGGHSREDLDLALTLKYWNKKAFLVPQSQVALNPPRLELGLKPWDLPQLAVQSSEDTCGGSVVHLRQKWGVVLGQYCRGSLDSALKGVAWGEGDLGGGGGGGMGGDMGGQARLLLAMLSLWGFNRFQVHFLPPFRAPRAVPPLDCESRDGFNCPRSVPWMRSASDSAIMMEAVARLEGALAEAQRQLEGGNGSASPLGSPNSPPPQLWVGRSEAHLPLRYTPVVDSWKASALQSGQLFPVRRAAREGRVGVGMGAGTRGRKAPDLPPLSRLYLPFLLVELELVVPRWRVQGLEPQKSPQEELLTLGFSLVLREKCVLLTGGKQGESGGKGGESGGERLITPGGRNCSRKGQHLRAFMYIRHLEGDDSPMASLERVREALLGGGGPKERPGRWVGGEWVRAHLAGHLSRWTVRLRAVACAPGSGEACSLSLPLGFVPRSWQLLLWAWKPQSISTALALLLRAPPTQSPHTQARHSSGQLAAS